MHQNDKPASRPLLENANRANIAPIACCTLAVRLGFGFSSLLSRLSVPFYGPYGATKFALETLSETYRAELSGFGVDVALIEPGVFKSTLDQVTGGVYAALGIADIRVLKTA